MVSEQDLRRIAAFVDADGRRDSAVPTVDSGRTRGVADD
jgi:hypothetical protein